MQMRVNSTHGAKALSGAGLRSVEDQLTDNVLENNFTLMPQWLEPLAQTYGEGQKVCQLTFSSQPGVATGVTALALKKWRWGLPTSHLETFLGDFPISGTPLLDASDPLTAATGLLRQAFEGNSAQAMLLSHVAGRQAIVSVLEDACANLSAPMRAFDSRQRAALCCNGDYEAWFLETFSRKRRKEFRRLTSRLEETGELTFRANTPQGTDLDDWIEAFCGLEKAGWKGRNGTAVSSTAVGGQFLKQALHRLTEDGKLVCWTLRQGNKPLAMMFGVQQAGVCWLVKIARDESYDKYSPGVLLVLKATQWMFQQEEILFADSCAEPDHSMIDHLWKERIGVRDVLIGRPGQSRAVFAVLAGLEQLRRTVKKQLKAVLKRA